MTQEIIIAGFGGQGVLSMGKILAYAGLMEGKEVSWMPAYGPEQRGGTANVTVIVSDDPISSPILSEFDTAIVLNQPSLKSLKIRLNQVGLKSMIALALLKSQHVQISISIVLMQ